MNVLLVGKIMSGESHETTKGPKSSRVTHGSDGLSDARRKQSKAHTSQFIVIVLELWVCTHFVRAFTPEIFAVTPNQTLFTLSQLLKMLIKTNFVPN
jgi:hypothetical protein